MKIGDRCFVHGYVDEIRKDTVIVRNDGGYFGTTWNEVTPSAQPEIIRCKDCKWKNRHNCTRAVEVFIDDDKYCAWAERRTDE
jgi:hypothetical protein